MIAGVTKSALISVGAATIVQAGLDMIGSTYLNLFLRSNLINIQIALLAVNSATMGIVLTKIRDLVDRASVSNAFTRTRAEMLLSIKEQMALIGVSIFILSTHDVANGWLPGNPFVFSVSLLAVFIYSMMILYDIAKSVLLVVDFSPKG